MKLLIGYDGSAGAVEAVEDLARAGLPASGVEAQVVTIADVWPEQPGEDYARAFPRAADRVRAYHDRAIADAQRIADEGAAKLTGLFAGWRVEAVAAADSPYWGLVTRAQKIGADLVVVGSHGKSALSRAVLGSVSQNVAIYAECNVRLGRNSPGAVSSDNKALRLILGWDGSGGARSALDTIVSRHWPAGTQVQVIAALDVQFRTAIPLGFGAAGAWDPAVAYVDRGEDQAQMLRQSAEQAVEQLRKRALNVPDALLLEGNPRHVLLEHAERWEADCIFVGARGLSRMQRVLLGSVSTSVAARAGCSVEIARQ